MGAPGHYILCVKGHEIGMIEDDLYWDEKMFKLLEDLEKKECPICGGKAKYNFCHYGDINDCTDVKLTWNPKEKRWIIPRKLSERQKKDLKDHVIRKQGVIKTEKVIESDDKKITGVRFAETDIYGKAAKVLAKYPRNEGSGVTIERDCAVEVEIDGNWHKLWEVRISSRYVKCDVGSGHCGCD